MIRVIAETGIHGSFRIHLRVDVAVVMPFGSGKRFAASYFVDMDSV